MIDEELRAPAEEVCQRRAALVGVEFVLLVDPDPRQLLPPSRQVIAAVRQLLLRLEQFEPGLEPLFTCPGLVLRHRSSPLLVFDERPQTFGRVVPLRRDVVEVPLCDLQAFAIQIPDPLAPAAGVADEPHVAEGVGEARNRLTRDPRAFPNTGNPNRPPRQGSQAAEPVPL